MAYPEMYEVRRVLLEDDEPQWFVEIDGTDYGPFEAEHLVDDFLQDWNIDSWEVDDLLDEIEIDLTCSTSCSVPPGEIARLRRFFEQQSVMIDKLQDQLRNAIKRERTA